nr:hypothetical protein [Tanacetum cinerariifolium]
MPLGNETRTANILEPMTHRCSKYMTENLKLLTNFVEKFLGTVKFRNDQIAPILGYGDLGNDLLIVVCDVLCWGGVSGWAEDGVTLCIGLGVGLYWTIGVIGPKRARKYYVFNPTTKQFAIILCVPGGTDVRKTIRSMSLMYNKKDCVHSKVVCIQRAKANGVLFHISDQDLFQIQIYSTAFCLISETLRFAWEALRFVYLQDLAFCLGSTAFCEEQFVAFCADIAFCPRSSDCLLSHLALRFVSLLGLRFVKLQDITQMHNNIMVAGSRDRQHDDILNGVHVETPINMSPENKAHFKAEKEAIHLILSGIRDEIYSTIDAWQTAQEISHTTTKHKGKEIAKPITPPSETASEEDNDPEQAQRDNDMQKNLALIAKCFKKIYKPTNNNIRTSSNSRNKNVDTSPRHKNDNQSGQFRNQRMVNVAGAREKVGSPVVQQSGIQCFNCKEYGHFAKECRKLKIVKDSTYHKDKMLLCKQAEQEAHYSYMAKIQEVPTAKTGTDSEPVEHVQNDAGYNVFANDLQHSEQSKSVSNTCLVETDDSNVIPDSPDIKSLGESISVRDSSLVALQNKQTEFEKYKAFNDRTIDYELVKEKHDELIKQSLLTKSHYKGLVKQKTKVKTDLKLRKEHDIEKMLSMEKQLKFLNEVVYKRSQSIKTIYMMAPKTCLMPLAIKTQNDSFRFVHELKQEMHADLKYVESIEKEIDRLKSDKAEFSNMYDMILQEYLKAQLQGKNIAISELKKLIEKGKGKSVDTKFDKPSVVRQPNAQRIPKPSVLGVNHNTIVSRPQRKSNQLQDKVVPNNSQVKFAPIIGYGDLVQGNVAFKKSTCFVRDLQGNDLLTGNRRSDLCTISLQESTSSTLLYLMAKATPTQAWLWHQRLSHLNFDNINLLSKKDIVIGLPKLKYVKDQLCLSCELSKAKKSSFKSKVVPSSKGRLNLLHIDLGGPMRVASINGKKYILVIVDDYSRYMWTLFLRSKDETPEVLKEFLTMIQRNLQALVITVRTDRGTEFLNRTLNEFFKEEGIEH